MTVSNIGGSVWPPQSGTLQDLPSAGQTLPGSTSSLSSAGGISPTGLDQDDPVKAFEDYMSEPPAQRMMDAWLAQHGVSKEEFAAMSPEKKQALMDQMKREIEQKMESQSGVPGSSSPVPRSSAYVSGGFLANAL